MTVHPLDLRRDRRAAGVADPRRVADGSEQASSAKRAVFSTERLDPRLRFEAWRTLLGHTHDIDAARDGFAGRLVTTDLKRMLVHEMDATPQSVARTSARARRDGQEHVVLHLTTAPFAFTFEGGAADVPAGAVTVNVVSRAFQRSRAAETGSIVISLARDLVEEVLPEPELFHGSVLHGGIGGLLADHMRSLARVAADLPEAASETLGRATLQMLAAALLPTQRAIGEGRNPLQASALLRCKRHIRQHLGTPDLGPDRLCKALGLSRSALYRLFEPAGGVAAFIRNERLNAAHRLLQDPQRNRRVSEVVTLVGYSDDVAFARAFRAAFGMKPSDAVDAPRAAELAASGDLIADWLRGVST